MYVFHDARIDFRIQVKYFVATKHKYEIVLFS